jgi:hypothetical protein
MPTDWLDELNKIREEAQTKGKEDTTDLDLSLLGESRPPRPKNLLLVVDAHSVLRKTNSVLLGGKGTVTFVEGSSFDYAISLTWQGTIAKPRRPDPEDPGDYSYITVGCKKGKVYINGKALKVNTPEALKEALVAAARKPGVQPKEE